MIEFKVSFPVITESGTKEEFQVKFDNFIQSLLDVGYIVPVAEINDHNGLNLSTTNQGGMRS